MNSPIYGVEYFSIFFFSAIDSGEQKRKICQKRINNTRQSNTEDTESMGMIGTCTISSQ